MDNNQQSLSKKGEGKKIAIVHDFLVTYGGAERVLEALAEMFPEAPIYTLLTNPKFIDEHLKNRDVRASWLSRLPNFLKKHYRFFLPFFPVAVESFDLRDFDVVISSSGAWSKGIVTRLNTKHIAYLHSPMRYAWDYHEEYLNELGTSSASGGKLRIFTRMLISYLRVWDRQAAERPDAIISNSQFTAARVKKYYRRESVVVYPPVSLHEQVHARNVVSQAGESFRARTHFLIVSRLTRSKKIEIAIEAFNKLGLPLIIVGDGPERSRLQKQAEKNIQFVGFIADEELAKLYVSARAVIFPSEEDFGMVAAEALSFGTPVIAYEYGGIQEIVSSGKTGELFHAQTPEIIAEGVHRFLEHEGQYDEIVMKQSVVHLTKENFQKQIREFLQVHL